jgi:hypothetical protein
MAIDAGAQGPAARAYHSHGTKKKKKKNNTEAMGYRATGSGKEKKSSV